MYKKIILILIVILLSGCSKRNVQVACHYIKQDSTIDLDIKAINDDISSVSVRECIEIPNNVMVDENMLDFLCKQLDDSYHFEDNILVKEYSLVLDFTYSLSKTLDYLKTKRYVCE